MAEPTLCRRCGLPLEGAAIRIGICVSCIQAASFVTPPIPRPRYLADGEDDDDQGSEYGDPE